MSGATAAAEMLYSTALELAGIGLSPIPLAGDGSKRPFGSWKSFQDRQPTESQLLSWFGRKGAGTTIGVVLREGVEMIEVEGRFVDHYAEITDRMLDAGLEDLWCRVETGLREMSPSGGVHFFVRSGSAEGNKKLASRPATPEELAVDPDTKVKVLIETRGAGGFVVTHPTVAHIEDYGRTVRWVRTHGSPAGIPTLTAEEREAVLEVLRSFDEMPATKVYAAPKERAPRDEGELPGDHFARTHTWADVLEPHGWVFVYTDSADVTYWRRPGKTAGISASTNYAASSSMRVFTSSAYPLEAETAYSLFGAYATLHHGGDFHEAARAIRQEMPRDDHRTARPPAVTVREPPPAPEPNDAPEPAGAYPFHVWPGKIGAYFAALGAAVGADPAMAATLALPILGAAIGTDTRLWVTDTWKVRTIFYATVIAPPSAAKSPVGDAMRRPVEDLEAELERDRRCLIEADMEVGPYRHLLASDATTEGLIQAMADNSRGLLLYRDELAAWVKAMGQYKGGRGDDQEQFLSAFNGSVMKVLRKGAAPLVVPASHLCIGGTIQPTPAQDLLLSRIDNGLAQRFLYCVAQDVPYRAGRPDMPISVADTWAHLVRGLYNLNGDMLEVPTEERAIATEILAGIEPHANGEDQAMAQYARKMETYYWRLVLLLTVVHRACGGPDTVTEDTVRWAWSLTAYYLEQWQTAQQVGGPRDEYVRPGPKIEADLIAYIHKNRGVSYRTARKRGPSAFRQLKHDDARRMVLALGEEHRLGVVRDQTSGNESLVLHPYG